MPVYCLNKDIICNGAIDCANGIDEKACCDDDGPCDSKIYTSTIKPMVQSATDQSGMVYYSLIGKYLFLRFINVNKYLIMNKCI